MSNNCCKSKQKRAMRGSIGNSDELPMRARQNWLYAIIIKKAWNDEVAMRPEIVAMRDRRGLPAMAPMSYR